MQPQWHNFNLYWQMQLERKIEEKIWNGGSICMKWKIWSLYYFVAILLHIKCSISDQNVEYTFSLKISFLFNLIPRCLRQIWGMNICNDTESKTIFSLFILFIGIWSIIHWIFQREFLLKKPGLKLHNLWKEWIYYSIKMSLWVCFLLHRFW